MSAFTEPLARLVEGLGDCYSHRPNCGSGLSTWRCTCDLPKRKAYSAALARVERLATDMETALGEARFILTPSCYKGTDAHNDQWRLDRARWQKQHGDPALALAELADMNALRRMYAHEGKPGNDPVPDAALDEPVNDRAVLSAREEGTP